MSKTYSVTGWRVGWAIAPPEASVPIRKVHDFLTVGAAAPLQQAGAVALELPDSYYQKLAEMYRVKRDRMLGILTDAGFRCFKPAGAYYIMTDISGFDFPDDISFSRYLVEKIGVAVVPGSSFYDDPKHGRAPGALHVLQKRIDAGRLRGKTFEAPRLNTLRKERLALVLLSEAKNLSWFLSNEHKSKMSYFFASLRSSTEWPHRFSFPASRKA